MTVSRDATLLNSFCFKVEESLRLVACMSSEDKLKAVQFWNTISEKLQEIVNDSAADFHDIALKINKEEEEKVEIATENKVQKNLASHEIIYINSTDEAASTHDSSNIDTNQFHLQQNILPQPVLNEPIPKNDTSTTADALNSTISFDIIAESQKLDDDKNIQLVTKSDFLTSTESVETNVVSILSPTITNVRSLSPYASPQKSNKKKNVKKKTSKISMSPRQSKNIEDGCSDKVNNSNNLSYASNNGDCDSISFDDVDDPPSDLDCQLKIENSNELNNDEIVINNSCDKLVPVSNSLVNTVQKPYKPHRCLLCDAHFATVGNLRVHARRHTGEKPYLCSSCMSCFSTLGNLKRHMRIHAGLKPWRCEECDRCFAEKKTLRVHMRRHTGEKPYQCKVCGKFFTQTGVLKTHMALHADVRGHLCDVCGKSFRQKSQLQTHRLRHDNVRKYGCDSCSTFFYTKGDLERHMRTHTGEKPYTCKVCSKNFTRQQTLNEHLNRHYGIKPYSCQYCKKEFVEMSACYKHVKQHEKNMGISKMSVPKIFPKQHAETLTKVISVEEDITNKLVELKNPEYDIAFVLDVNDIDATQNQIVLIDSVEQDKTVLLMH